MLTEQNVLQVARQWFDDWNRHDLEAILAGVNSLVLYYPSVNNLLSAEYMEIGDRGLIAKVSAHYIASLNES
jgi:hypothetical protein